VSLALAILGFTEILARAAIANHARPTVEGVILGAVTDFFDTLGIGSFAPTTAWLKFRKLVLDRLIPSTLLVGHGLPTMADSVIFLILLGVKVDAVSPSVSLRFSSRSSGNFPVAGSLSTGRNATPMRRAFSRRPSSEFDLVRLCFA
jgi:hypothetical protein